MKRNLAGHGHRRNSCPAEIQSLWFTRLSASKFAAAPAKVEGEVYDGRELRLRVDHQFWTIAQFGGECGSQILGQKIALSSARLNDSEVDERFLGRLEVLDIPGETT